VNATDDSILAELGLVKGDYFLFVGRFIPDKGLQYLVPAYEKTSGSKKLVLVGGSPNPSEFEAGIRSTKDPRIVFPGFVYGAKAHALMKHAYAYIQPSDVEGLSPVVLENMGFGTPVICSDIKENRYVVADAGLLFRRGDIADLSSRLEYALASPVNMREMGILGKRRAAEHFSWDRVTEAHECVFRGGQSPYVDNVEPSPETSAMTASSQQSERSTA
jgi:glycosyltransferase involved in cell wall biosynthesis